MNVKKKTSSSKSTEKKPKVALVASEAKTKKTVKPKASAAVSPKKSIGSSAKKVAKPTTTKTSKTGSRTTKPVAGKADKPKARASSKSKLAPIDRLLNAVRAGLDELKALSLIELDVRGQSDVTDTVVIASGTSDRHVKSIADRVREKAREAGFRVIGTEGERDGEWILIDLGDVIVHVMLPRVRDLYALERLWSVRVEDR
jgi:ribosome-associated protein